MEKEKSKAACYVAAMKTTRYFDEQVLRKRPYLLDVDLAAATARPLRREVQADGRTRLWSEVVLPSMAGPRILRIVLLEDGETIHNASLDRDCR